MRDRHTTITQQPIPPASHRRKFTRVFTGVMAAAAAGMLALTGCTGTKLEADPTLAPPTSIAATSAPPTTAAPTPTAAPTYQPATENGPAQNVPIPVLPDAAKEFSKQGLIAFAEYWYSTLGYAFETGDPEPMMAISGPDCSNCEGARQSVIKGHSDGKWIVGGQMHFLSSTTSFAPLDDESFQIIAMVQQDQVKYYKTDGTLSKDLGVTIAAPDILIATFQDSRWRAQKIAHLEANGPPQ